MPMAIILDDDDGIRETLRILLEDEGYTVAAFAYGGDALAYLQGQTTPHLVLTDYLMPGMSGAEFLHEALIACQSIPHVYIMLAARSRFALPGDAQKVLAQWHIPFVKKPYELDALLATIDASKPNALDSSIP